MYVGYILYRDGSGDTNLRVGDVGYVPAHWEESDRLLPSSGTQTDGTAIKDNPGWYTVLTPTDGGNGGRNGGGNIGGGNAGDFNLSLLPPKHCRTIYCNKANYDPVSGVGVASRGTDLEAVLGAGEHFSTGDTGDRAGGRGVKGTRGAGGRGDIWRDKIIRQWIMYRLIPLPQVRNTTNLL